VLQIARLNNIPKARRCKKRARLVRRCGARRLTRHGAQDLIERNIKRATDKSQADYTEARAQRGGAAVARAGRRMSLPRPHPAPACARLTPPRRRRR
jgi:hypothetical protein